jgi:hypothetical protein
MKRHEMIKVIISLIGILFIIGLSDIRTYAQTAEDVYKSLARIDDTTLSGIDFEEYSRLVIHAMTEQKVFKIYEGRDNPETVDIFQRIIDKHSLLREYWSSIKDKNISERERLFKQIQEIYPEIKDPTSTTDEFVFHSFVVKQVMMDIHRDFEKLEMK